MSRLDKVIGRIRARPPQARFDDVRLLLEAYGWRMDRERGSHVTFVKAGEVPIVVPKVGGRWVKRVYLDDVCDRLELDD